MQRITKVEVNKMNSKQHSPLFLTVMRPAYHHYTPYQGSREKDRLCIVKSLLLSGTFLLFSFLVFSLLCIFYLFLGIIRGSNDEERQRVWKGKDCITRSS